jgi:hypothetical protein
MVLWDVLYGAVQCNEIHPNLREKAPKNMWEGATLYILPTGADGRLRHKATAADFDLFFFHA